MKRGANAASVGTSCVDGRLRRRELYLLGNGTGVPFGETAVVMKLVPHRD
jgi:hypothetical protein